MALIDAGLRGKLKKPLGKVLPFEEALAKAGKRKIIAVGDEVVYNMLEAGRKPFVAVFDFSTLRKPVAKEIRGKLEENYPNYIRTSKPAGEISIEMFEIAQEMLREGGALFVDGEEDLFALPFSLLAKGEIVLYGQPGKGCVFVEKGSFKKEEYWKIIEKMGLRFPHVVK
jgi:uncharacterized protein (UPF0218 family)